MLSILLAVLMSMVASLASAYDAKVNGIYYNLVGMTAIVTNNGTGKASYEGDVVIPEKMEYYGATYTIVGIGDHAFSGCDKLTSISMPETLTSIGNGAFRSCDELTSVVIPDNVITVGSADYPAFDYCKKIETLVVGKGVTDFNLGTWIDLKKIIIRSNALLNTGSEFYTGGAEEIVIDDGVTSVGNNAFRGLKENVTISIPNSVTCIGEYCFLASEFTSIKLPDNITSIGKYAFAYCKMLESINLPEKLIEVSESLFYDCDALKSIVIPNEVTTIKNSAFEGCENITSLHIGSGVRTIKEQAFRTGSKFKTINIPDNVEAIYRGAFTCEIDTLIIGRGLKNVWRAAFYVNNENNHTTEVFCYASEPPFLNLLKENEIRTIFAKAENVTLHVPTASLSAYRNAMGWNKCGIIVPMVIKVDEIHLSMHDAQINVGEILKMNIDISPVDADNKNVFWSVSDKSIITVDESGNVKAIKAGTAWVKAVSEDNPEAKDSCLIVVKQPVKSVVLTPSDYTFTSIGQSLQLNVAIMPADASNKNVFWSSSNEHVCTVEDGKLTSKGKGTAIITVTTEDGGHTAICNIIVKQGVTGISINQEILNLHSIGESVQLTATVLPEDAENKKVIWSSLDEKVCKVVDGFVLAVGEGTTVITATTEDGGFTAKCVVTVNVQKPVTSVTLNYENYILRSIGESVQLKATVLPENANNKKVTWKSSDEKVCTVVEGKVTATGEGKATITATTEDGGFTATCAISVEINHPVTSISLNRESYTMHATGETIQLKATILPSNATNKKVTWTSSNTNVCTVANGLVTATGEGKATITATTEDGGFTATCVISVEINHPVTDISLNYDNYVLSGIGESVQLKANILPENATNKDVTWKSYNENVCIVNKGLVIGIGYGTAVVSVTTVDGNHMATCTITVEDNTPVNSIGANNQGYKVYSLQGREQTHIQKGLNIIRFNDGTVKKVMVK